MGDRYARSDHVHPGGMAEVHVRKRRRRSGLRHDLAKRADWFNECRWCHIRISSGRNAYCSELYSKMCSEHQNAEKVIEMEFGVLRKE